MALVSLERYTTTTHICTICYCQQHHLQNKYLSHTKRSGAPWIKAVHVWNVEREEETSDCQCVSTEQRSGRKTLIIGEY